MNIKASDANELLCDNAVLFLQPQKGLLIPKKNYAPIQCNIRRFSMQTT